MITKQKQIEREKQIAAAALVYANEICKNRVRDKYNLSDQVLIGLAFFNGVKLADENPRPGLVEIDDVEDIYMEWFKCDSENSTFLEYFANYCKKEGWL